MCKYLPDSVKRTFWTVVDAVHPRRAGGPVDVVMLERMAEERRARAARAERDEAERERREDEAALNYLRARLGVNRRDL